MRLERLLFVNKTNPDIKYFEKIKNILKENEEWLMERILNYGIQRGYSAYTSTLKEAWRLSISGLSKSIIYAMDTFETIPELSPEEESTDDPITCFGINEAQKHRERGISMNMFLGLMKYYRQSYIDLIHSKVVEPISHEYYELFINRVFDRIEIAFCVEWSEAKGDKALRELQIKNRIMTNEKNKYLTIFESILDPVIILNKSKEIDNINNAAVTLFKGNYLPGSQYYNRTSSKDITSERGEYQNNAVTNPLFFTGSKLAKILPWLKNEVDLFMDKNYESMVFEKNAVMNNHTLFFHIKISKSLDISGKFDGLIIILEDITNLKQAIEEVHTLRGIIPICSYCKNIRDDEGYWQRVESYIGQRSEAEFSHSICPDCASKYCSDLGIYDDLSHQD